MKKGTRHLVHEVLINVEMMYEFNLLRFQLVTVSLYAFTHFTYLYLKFTKLISILLLVSRWKFSEF